MLNRNRNRSVSQVAYSVRELASLAGMSKGRMARVLSTNGVELSRSGNKRLVFLSSLERALPDLVDSCRFRGDQEE